MSGTNTPLLSVQDLSVSFGEGYQPFPAVIDLNLEVFQGEIVGLIGESGSGKTTSAHALLGLIEGYPGIVSGQAALQGETLLPPMAPFVKQKNGHIRKRLSSFRKSQSRLLKNVLGRKMAAIFQEPKSALNPFRSIKEHILESIARSTIKVDQPQQYGQDTLAQVGIVDGALVWNQYPHQLSGGMAQRVMIAMALCCNPRLLIADEPTTALDVTTQAKLLDFFLTQKIDRGLSILLITHDIGVIHEIADRVYVMLKGRIVESGTTATVLNRPQHQYTRKLLNSFEKIGGERRIKKKEGARGLLHEIKGVASEDRRSGLLERRGEVPNRRKSPQDRRKGVLERRQGKEDRRTSPQSCSALGEERRTGPQDRRGGQGNRRIAQQDRRTGTQDRRRRPTDRRERGEDRRRHNSDS